MMLEAMVQAGGGWWSRGRMAAGCRMPLVLGKVRALKYGRFVKPGAALRVEVTLGKKLEGEWDLRGEATVIERELSAKRLRR
jgi:3-hydroxymyristoyl/3-hydroxydecanoyl-(acyl carrier protein) dehydratase